MSDPRGDVESSGFRAWVRKNLANILTLTSLLPVPWLFQSDGATFFLILVAIDAMDNLDGMAARRFGISSTFGAQLDRTCDALAHGAAVVAVGLRLPDFWGLCALPAVMAIAVRLTRQSVGVGKSQGSSTNELLRHLLLALLLEQVFARSLVVLIAGLMLLHALTMLWNQAMPHLPRRRFRTNAAILFFSAVHVGAIFTAWISVPLALITWGAYVMCFLPARGDRID